MSFQFANINSLDVQSINNIPVTNSTPAYTHTTVSILAFGYSLDSNACFAQSTSAQPQFYVPAVLPNPSTTPIVIPTGNEVYGTVTVSLLPGKYILTYTFFQDANSGKVQIDITANGFTTSSLTDCFSAGQNIAQVFMRFNVSGSGYQNVTIKMYCKGRNPLSPGYFILPNDQCLNIDQIPA